MIGQTISHYRILQKVGEGGMGVVFKAEDTRLGRMVAVKFLSESLAKDAMSLERFQREARAASSISHPHIAAIYDVGNHDGLPFLVMELLEGDTLRHRLGGRPIDMETLIEYALQTADALDAAHGAGLIHRDIKTANLFITTRGQLKVLDFGLAKRQAGYDSDSDSDTELASPVSGATVTGQTLGTLAYMSPEQARGDTLDPRTDLFSFGVVLFQMATGRDPFTGKTQAMVLDSILHGDPPAASSINPAVPPELDRIIAKALEKNREMRYQTASELRADLRRLRRESGASDAVDTRRQSGVTSTASLATPGAASARAWPRLVAAAVALVAVAALAVWALRGGDTIDSVAVLPFTSDDESADTAYLSDGVSETLINGLTQVPELRVAARSLAFRYRGADVDPLSAGRDLGVTAVVTGRIATRGDRLVIQADLINVDDGSQIWGGQYNRSMDDLLTVQEEIADEILATLRPQLGGTITDRALTQDTTDVEAYRLYLQGRYQMHAGTLEGYQNATGYFQQAIASDRNYALAYAGLADSYLMLGSYWVEALLQARSAAERALELDPDLAEAHVAMGDLNMWLDWDWAAAEAAFTRGLELAPRSALAHNQYATYLAVRQRFTEALAQSRQALDLEPLSPIINADLGTILLYSGDIDAAIAQFERALEIDSNSVAALQGLGIAYSLDGQHQRAIERLDRALVLSQRSPIVLGHVGAAHARSGNAEAARLTLADLTQMADSVYVPASSMAVVHAALGNPQQAADWLERGYDEHDFALPRLAVAPWFADLRDDSRVAALINRLGLRN